MPFMMGIGQLLASLDEYDLTFPDLMAFVRLACMAKPFIRQCMTDIRHPPIHPPEVVVSLLAGALGQDPPTILACWVAFRQIIWTHGAVLPTDQEIEAFNRHGLVRGIGALLFVFSLLSLTCFKPHRVSQLVSTDTCMPAS
jgi:hypothetical protein